MIKDWALALLLVAALGLAGHIAGPVSPETLIAAHTFDCHTDEECLTECLSLCQGLDGCADACGDGGPEE